MCGIKLRFIGMIFYLNYYIYVNYHLIMYAYTVIAFVNELETNFILQCYFHTRLHISYVTKTETQETAAALARSNIWRDICCYSPRCDLVSAPGFCASGPCVHGACIDGFFRAFCLCSAGFQGPRCQFGM